MNKTTILNILLGLFVAVIINISGIIKIISNTNISPGQYSPYVTPIIFLLFILLLSFYNVVIPKIKNYQLFYLLFFFLVILIFLFSFKTGNIIQGLKDLVYILLIISFYHVLVLLNKSDQFDEGVYVKSLIFISGFFFPLIAFMIFGYSGRFGGLTLSKPIFGNMYVVYTMMLISIHAFKKPFLNIIILLFILPVILSGSRTALYLIIILFILLNWRSKNENVYYLKSSKVLFSIIFIIFSVFITSGYFVSSGLRVFDFSDVGVYDGGVLSYGGSGSISTRLLWYYKLLMNISKNYFIGGFGAGSSETLIGYLPHFDFLRYWYDYSILFPLIFIIFLFKINNYYKIKNNTSYYKALIYLSYFFIIILSMHNIFQEPGFVLLVTSYIYILNKNILKNKKSSVDLLEKSII